jgi:glycosyltransferase involved in cell wall biosynthesis
MHIILVIYGGLDQVTGGYLYDRKVVSFLRAKGIEVEVASLPSRPYMCAALQGLTAQVRSLIKSRGGKKHDRPLVVIDELTHPSLLIPLLFRSGTLGHVVVLVHHLRCDERRGPIGRLISGLIERLLLNRSAHIIVNSSITEISVRKRLRREIPLFVCRPGCDTLPQPLDTAEGIGMRHSEEGVRLLTVGNIIPRKGHMALIRGLRPLRHMKWRLTIVGKDEPESRYSKRLHALIDAEDMGCRVSFAGTVDDRELVRLYSSADIFLFPSSHEGYGIALAEALRFGLPFIASDSGGVREIVGMEGQSDLDAADEDAEEGGRRAKGVRRCRGGFLTEQDHTEAFGLCLRRLIEDSELRKNLSAEATERSRELPSWDDTGACFYRALQAAVDTGKSQSLRSCNQGYA